MLDLRQRQIVKGVGIRRLVDKVLLETRARFIEFTLLCQQNSQRMVGQRMLRPQLDDPPVIGLGLVGLTQCLADESQQAPGAFMLGVGLHDLTANVFGSLQTTAFMVLNRNCKGFGDRCHRSICGVNVLWRLFSR